MRDYPGSVKGALVHLNAAYADETLTPTLKWAYERCHDKRTAGRALNPKTYYNWVALARERGSLAPGKKEKNLSVPAWARPFLEAYQKPQKPSMCAAYRQAFGVEPLDSGRDGIPSIHQVRRWLAEVGTVSREAGRRLPRELKALLPFVRRTTAHMMPDDCFTADGHRFDAEIAHPVHKRAFRPEITTVLSVSTRKCVGWSAGLAESTWAVLDAQRHAIETHGIPAIWYVDNGSGYKNAMQADEVVGFATRLGIEIKHSLPYNSQARGVEERSHRSILVEAAKKLPTYMGAAMDREARQKVHKITRADIRVAGTSRLLMDFEDFKVWLQGEIDAYNARPHLALPMMTDAEGKRRHMSPNEAWEAALATGWAPTMLTPEERDDVFRPYKTAKVIRGEIRLNNNLYYSDALLEFHGETVRVGYDIHDASRVWVRDHDNDRLICVAEFEANHRAYYPQSVIDQASEKRAAARIRRLGGKLDEVRAELEGGPLALEHQTAETLPVDLFTASREKHEAAAALEIEASNVVTLAQAGRRPMFDTDPEKYRWLIAHVDDWDADDAGWLVDYVASDDYRWLRERYEALGQAWTDELARRAEETARHEEVAAR